MEIRLFQSYVQRIPKLRYRKIRMRLDEIKCSALSLCSRYENGSFFDTSQSVAVFEGKPFARSEIKLGKPERYCYDIGHELRLLIDRNGEAAIYSLSNKSYIMVPFCVMVIKTVCSLRMFITDLSISVWGEAFHLISDDHTLFRCSCNGVELETETIAKGVLMVSRHRSKMFILTDDKKLNKKPLRYSGDELSDLCSIYNHAFVSSYHLESSTARCSLYNRESNFICSVEIPSRDNNFIKHSCVILHKQQFIIALAFFFDDVVVVTSNGRKMAVAASETKNGAQALRNYNLSVHIDICERAVLVRRAKAVHLLRLAI